MITVELIVVLNTGIPIYQIIFLAAVPRTGEYVILPGFGEIGAPVHSVIYRAGSTPTLQFRIEDSDQRPNLQTLLGLGWRVM